MSEIKRLIKFFVDRIIEHYKQKDLRRRDKILKERAKKENERFLKEMLSLKGEDLKKFITFMNELITQYPHQKEDTLERLYNSYNWYGENDFFLQTSNIKKKL
jgi:hypothetical protein